jgi:flagellum-specific peptidoglycan hydrolase FlgJ
MGTGGGKQPKTTTQITELPAWARGYAKDILAKGAALTDINTNPYVTYGGERLAGFDPMQQQSFEDARNMGVAPQIGQATQMATQAGQYNPADFQNQYNNQLQQYTGANVNQYMNPYLEGALAPQLREAASAGMQAQNMNAAKAVGMGAFGGTRGALQQSMTEKNTMQNMADINAKGYNDAFNQAAGMFSADQQRRMQDAQLRAQFGLSADQAREQSRQFGAGQGLNAAQLLGQLGGQQFQQGMDINKLRNTYGAQQQALQQRGFDNAYQDFLDEQNYAYKQLGFMSDLIKNPAIGSRNQQQMYEPAPNMLSTVAGLGAVAKGAGIFKEGGIVGYADGGDITSYAERLSDEQIATLLEQEQRKPPQEQDQERIVALAAEIQRRADVRGAQATPPMEQGLAALPTGTVNGMQGMAGGGIVAFAGGDAVKGDPKARFMEEYGPAAEYAGKRLGVDPQILLAQWGLESDYGRKTVGRYNLGNIKDVTGKGPRALDKAEGSRDAYKSYESPEDFAADFAGLISRRYPDAVGAGSDVAKFAAGLKPGKQGGYATDTNYADKLAKVNAGLGGTPQAQAQTPVQPQAMSYSPAVAQIPGAAVDPRQTFRGPPAPPPPDNDFGGAGRLIGGFEGLGSLASTVPALGIGALKTLLTKDDKSLEQNFIESIYRPRTETGQAVVRKVGEVSAALNLPPYISGLAGLTAAASRGVSLAQKAAKDTEAAAAAANAKVALPRLPAPITAAEAKVAAPRLPSTPEDTSFMGRVRSGLDDIARKNEDQAAADAARAAREPGGLDAVARLKADQAAAARLAEEARIAPYNVQAQMLKAGDEAANARYAQGVADRTGKAGLIGLGAAANTPSEAVPSGLAAIQTTPDTPVAPEDLSKDDKKSLIDAAKATVPADERKKTGFDNEDWLMLGLNMLAKNTGGKGFGQVLGEAGLPTLMSKKEREKAEKERESQKYVDEYRQSQAELNRAQVDYFGEGRRYREADAAAAKAYENWLATEKANKMTSTNLTAEKAEQARQRILRETYERFNIPLPAGMYAAGPQAGATLKYDAATGTIK